MRTIANTIIAANSTKTLTMATASDNEPSGIMNVWFHYWLNSLKMCTHIDICIYIHIIGWWAGWDYWDVVSNNNEYWNKHARLYAPPWVYLMSLIPGMVYCISGSKHFGKKNIQFIHFLLFLSLCSQRSVSIFLSLLLFITDHLPLYFCDWIRHFWKKKCDANRPV